MSCSQQTHSSDLLNIPGREKTLAKLLADTNLLDDTKKELKNKGPQIPFIPPPEERKTYKIAPPTDILSRLQAFLPQLEAANASLQNMKPEDLDIEQVEEDEQYIEMNLGLGVYEHKRHESDSEDEDDEAEDIVMPNAVNNGNKAKPNIEFMSEDSDSD
ncbi:hypothetical protein CLU79DRAFT_890664 [Phycomyces nitens]|nr:hypothetical protein CLU79DRAFT_890664 [Phycomyces nitens]